MECRFDDKLGLLLHAAAGMYVTPLRPPLSPHIIEFTLQQLVKSSSWLLPHWACTASNNPTVRWFQPMPQFAAQHLYRVGKDQGHFRQHGKS